jgi:hypothetical protein
MKTTIKSIDCYGEWALDSNALLVGEWSDGTEMDDIWSPDEPYESWSEVVEHLSSWANDNGHEIVEITSC